MVEKKVFTVNKRENGKRLDIFLRENTAFSRKKIKAFLDNGAVSISGKTVVIAGWKLNAGDKVNLNAGSTEEKAYSSIRNIKIYHEDRDILVAEKPAGVPSVSKKTQGDSFENMVHAYLRKKHSDAPSSFIGALHRLDVETGGIVVFALSKDGKKLSKQFKTHSITREYMAIVHGRMDGEHGVINAPIEKGDFYGGRKARVVDDKNKDAKRAVTEYMVNERYSDATFLRVTVHTGRTHQIRVHLASMGFPIIGDRVYGKGSGGLFPFRRHALHAFHLAFSHPRTGKSMDFKSPMPADMKKLVDVLRMGNRD